VLRVISGRAWATLDVSRNTPLTETGDHFVALGHDLQLRAGQRVVVEAWAYKGQDGIQLQWVPAPEDRAASRWQAAVVDPVRDIGHGHGSGRACHVATGGRSGRVCRIPDGRPRPGVARFGVQRSLSACDSGALQVLCRTWSA